MTQDDFIKYCSKDRVSIEGAILVALHLIYDKLDDLSTKRGKNGINKP
jgi:hypothetical protein